jgi:hypothetical protein
VPALAAADLGASDVDRTVDDHRRTEPRDLRPALVQALAARVRLLDETDLPLRECGGDRGLLVLAQPVGAVPRTPLVQTQQLADVEGDPFVGDQRAEDREEIGRRCSLGPSGP